MKNSISPTNVPTVLIPIIQAFHANSKQAVKMLIKKAAVLLYGDGEHLRISKEELEGIRSMINGVNPNDSVEALYAAQMVACHILGMRKLNAVYRDDRKLGLSLLRFGNESMQLLAKKQIGG